jgi:hypothetical protein
LNAAEYFIALSDGPQMDRMLSRDRVRRGGNYAEIGGTGEIIDGTSDRGTLCRIQKRERYCNGHGVPSCSRSRESKSSSDRLLNRPTEVSREWGGICVEAATTIELAQ